MAMTNQDIFDKVARHLLTQGKPAMDGYACMYRAHDGSKCAVGCLISEEAYAVSFEGVPLGAVIAGVASPKCAELDAALKKSGIAEESYPLLVKLQAIHDGRKAVVWRGCLLDVAADFALNQSAIPA